MQVSVWNRVTACIGGCVLMRVFKELNQDDSAEPSMRGHQWVFVDHSVNCRRNSEFFLARVKY